MPFLCMSCQKQTDFVNKSPCKVNCPIFKPKKIVLVHHAIQQGNSYYISCLKGKKNQKAPLPISGYLGAVTCSRCIAISKIALEKESKPLPLPPEIDAKWNNVTFESLGYPKELIDLLTSKSWTVPTLRNALLSGNDIKTISVDYADIILASLNIGNKE